MRIMVVGCGRIAKKSHITALIENKSLFKCIYACDVAGANAKVFSELVSDSGAHKPIVINDYKRVLKNNEIEAVIVATESGTHYQIAKDALNTGKHVLVEKPLALSSEHMNQLLRVASQQSLKLRLVKSKGFRSQDLVAATSNYAMILIGDPDINVSLFSCIREMSETSNFPR